MSHTAILPEGRLCPQYDSGWTQQGHIRTLMQHRSSCQCKHFCLSTLIIIDQISHGATILSEILYFQKIQKKLYADLHLPTFVLFPISSCCLLSGVIKHFIERQTIHYNKKRSNTTGTGVRHFSSVRRLLFYFTVAYIQNAISNSTERSVKHLPLISY